MRVPGISVFLLLLSAACTTQQTAPATVSNTPSKELLCTVSLSAGALWTQYEDNSSPQSARRTVECAEQLEEVDSLLTKAASATKTLASLPKFEKAVSLIQAAAVAGNNRAQRILFGLYADKAGWYGRNTYLALFWRGIIQKSDPDFRGHPKVQTKLLLTEENLSSEAKIDLENLIANWRPGDSSPLRLAADTLFTYAMESKGQIPHPTIQNIINYGFKHRFVDADIMALIANTKKLDIGQRRVLFKRLADKGSLLALMFRLSEVDEKSDANQIDRARILFSVLERVGLDPSTLRLELFQEVEPFLTGKKPPKIDQLLVGKTKPQQRTMGLLLVFAVCGDGPTPACSAVMEKFDPILPITARLWTRFLRIMHSCPPSTSFPRCSNDLKNWGVFRDFFALDYVDFGGREI